MKTYFLVIALLFVFAVPRTAVANFKPEDLAKLRLPPKAQMTIYAQAKGARSMTFGAKGTLFVGTRDEGKVYAIHPGNPPRVETIATGLNSPNGVAFKDGDLYVAEINRIIKFAGAENPKPVSKFTVVYDKLPDEKAHGWKFLAFGPDGLLYVPIGVPCNICERGDPFGTIARLKPDGTGFEIFARGIRNSVGFDWDPTTKELWFTDNGRDWLGDDSPPDELNHAKKAGMDFGFPYCHGRDLKDPQFGKKADCKTKTPPEVEFHAHVASLGMRFCASKMFPPEYQGAIFVAEHGSWNRTTPIGYQVEVVRKNKAGVLTHEPFIDGWLQNQKTVIGRPVDVIFAIDGAMLISDDDNGLIYRLTFKTP